jgi:hypothetical protein
MVNTVWVTVTSLVGVVIGGMLSVITQRLTDRSAAHRFEATILEGRRRSAPTRKPEGSSQYPRCGYGVRPSARCP